MERQLSAHEAVMAAGDMRVATIWDIHGELDEKALEQALHQLSRAHPLLRGHFSGHGTALTVHLGDDAEPLPLHHGSDVSQEINLTGDWWQGPLLRASLVRRQDTTSLVTTLPRACVDGMCVVALHQSLLEHYADAYAGRRPPVDPVQPVLAPSVEDALHRRFPPHDLRSYVEERARTDARTPPDLLPTPAADGRTPGPDRTFGHRRVSVSPAQTSALTDLAHRHGLSVNSLVCGLLVAAVRPSLGPLHDPVSVCCGVAVDMRRRATPPVPNTVIQSAASGIPVRLEVGGPADPVALARDLAPRVREGVARGVPEREMTSFAYTAQQCPVTLFVTNLGKIAPPSLPGENTVAALRVLPLAHIPTLFVVVTRLGPTLSMGFPFSRAWYTDDQVDAVVTETRRLVDTLTSTR